MSGWGFSIETSGSSENTILRATKDGGVERVKTTNADYPGVNPGEKLVWISGMTEPFAFEAEEENRETGEKEKVTKSMSRLEVQVIAGPQRGVRFLVMVALGYVQPDGSTKPHVTPKTNFGKILGAILGHEVPRNASFDPAQIVRKPFFMMTDNTRSDEYIRIKFISARPHDPAIDGPIPGAGGAAPAKAPEPEPVAVAVAADPGDALFDEDL